VNNYLWCANEELLAKAQEICTFTEQISMVTDSAQINVDCYLKLDSQGLWLCSNTIAPLAIDEFYQHLQRRYQSSGAGLLTQAVKIKGKSHNQLRILDPTAGLGGDAFLLNLQGATITLIEQNPLLATILYYAIIKGYFSPSTQIIYGDSQDYLQQLKPATFDIIYLDPMFNHSKLAKAKKPMQLVQQITSADNNSQIQAEQLFHSAQNKVAKIVVKRENKQQQLVTTPRPDGVKYGKTVRYDIYSRCLSSVYFVGQAEVVIPA